MSDEEDLPELEPVSTSELVNLFPGINFPSWIKQPLSLLGKASRGKVKADKWRNLYTMQLPLILPIYCILIFDLETVAPNHYMAIHLAECLKKSGPVRSWWAFPLERLMAQILKASHNNHIGP
ncbi:hypothetical protein PSTG_04129 [Puccinia striiformis f. sp. tritici PST-78]|uniref:Uncharacterized protein n=1 Tax=Puccinia striiformis f. sp. tritici PST-78 TaxID=1165861 RepID=A0A0L0VU83_9BASI|nr:hypothetical protein PSTG_04129 [Puccinia striiformis f. sp. tritici PST-78]